MADNESTLVVNVDASSAEASLNKLAKSLDAVMSEATQTAPAISKINTELGVINKNIASGLTRTLEKDIDKAGTKADKLNAQLKKLNTTINQMSTLSAQLRSLEAMAGKTTNFTQKITELNKKISSMNGQITRMNKSGEEFGVLSTHIQKVSLPIRGISEDFRKAEIAATKANKAIATSSTQAAISTDNLQKAVQKNKDRMANYGVTAETAQKRVTKATNENTRSLLRSNKEMQNMAVYGVYNLKQVSRGTEGFGQSLLKLTNRIIAATVVYKAFTGLLAGITGFVKSTIDTAVYFEKMQSSMTAVTGSYKAAEVEIAYLTETSKKFGISVEEIGAAYVKLSAAARGTTFSLEDVHRVFEATVVSGRVLNLTGLEMKGMLYALQQMISKGKVSMEELRLQLGDRLPGAMGLAAAAMEMPVSQLEKLISTGQVKSIDFLKKFSDYILTEFSPGMTVASTTIEFARGRFQNFYTDMKKTFGTGMKTQYAETLDLFTVGLANMSDEAERTGVSIGNMWSNFNDFLVKVVSGAWYENQVIYFAALKEQFNDLLATAGTSTSGMGDIVDSFLRGIGTTWDEVFSYLPTAPFDMLKTVEIAFSTTGNKILVATNAIMLSFVSMVRYILETILMIPQKILQTMQNMINSVLILVTNAFDSINSSLPESFRIDYDRKPVDDYVTYTNTKLANMATGVGDVVFGSLQETYKRIIDNNKKIIDQTEGSINERYQTRVDNMNSRMRRNSGESQAFLDKMRKDREETMKKMQEFQMGIKTFPDEDGADSKGKKGQKKLESSLMALNKLLAELFNTSDDGADKVAKLTLEYAKYAKTLGATHPQVQKLGVAIQFINEHGLTPGDWIDNTKKATIELKKLNIELSNTIAYGKDKNPNEYLQSIIEAEEKYAKNIKKGKEQIDERVASQIKEAEINKAYHQQEERFAKFRSETYAMQSNNSGNSNEAFRQQLNEKIIMWQQSGYTQIDIDARVNEELIAHNNQYVTTVEESWKEAWKRVDEAMVGALTGAGDTFSQLKSAFKQMLAEMAYQALLRPVVVQVMTAMGGMLNLGGGQLSYSNGAVRSNGAGGTGTGGGGLPNLAAGLFGQSGAGSSLIPAGMSNWFSGIGTSMTGGINSFAANMFPNTFAASGTTGQFNSLVNSITGSGLPTGTLTSGLSSVVSGIGSAASTFGLVKSIADMVGLSSQYSNVGTGAGTGAMIGSMFGPIGTGVGSVLGAIGGRLFSKRKPKRPAVWGGLEMNLADTSDYTGRSDEWFQGAFDPKRYGRPAYEETSSSNYFAVTRDRNKAGEEVSKAMNAVLSEVAKAGAQEASNIRKALPEKYAVAFNEQLKSKTLSFSYDFKGDDISEESFQKMSDEIKAQIEKTLISAFAALDLSEFEGKINIDKTSFQGIQNFTAALSLIKEVEDSTKAIRDPMSQIVQEANSVVAKLDEWKSAMLDVGVTTEYASELLKKYRLTSIDVFLDGVEQLAYPIHEFVAQAKASKKTFDDYNEALKILGATEGQLARVEQLRAEFNAQTYANIMKEFSDQSNMSVIIKQSNEQMDAWVKGLRELGIAEEQIMVVESMRAQYLQKATEQMLTSFNQDIASRWAAINGNEQVDLDIRHYNERVDVGKDFGKESSQYYDLLLVQEAELAKFRLEQAQAVERMMISFDQDMNSRWAVIKGNEQMGLDIRHYNERVDVGKNFGQDSSQYYDLLKLQEAELSKFRLDQAQSAYDKLNSQMQSLLNSQLNDYKRLKDEWKKVADSIAQTMKDMWTSNLNADSKSRLDVSVANFNDLYKKAMGGDVDAASQLSSSSKETLDLAKQSYGMQSDYNDLFYDIHTKLGDAQTLALDESYKVQRQIELAEEQLVALQGQAATTLSIDQQIKELRPQLDAAYASLQTAIANIKVSINLGGGYGGGYGSSGGGSSGSSGGGGWGGSGGSSGGGSRGYASADQIYRQKAKDMGVSYEAVKNAIRDAGGFTHWYQNYGKSEGYSLNSNPGQYQNSANAIYQQKAKDSGMSVTEIKNAINAYPGGFNSWYKDHGINEGYATGGVAQGIFRVGERGPETIISTDPARILNHHDTQNFLDGVGESSDDQVSAFLERIIQEEREIGKILIQMHSDVIRTRNATESTFDLLEQQYMTKGAV